ncbi:MAG: 4-hydroxyphenylacetate 3-hydroxylase family protein [Methanomassiliicoccales archaeon]
MMNGKQYLDSLRKMKTEAYVFGERIENVADHPFTWEHANAVAMTYELAHDPQYAELMTAKSHLTGKTINRFTHIHQSTEDLVKKVKMLRLLGRKTGSCFQRCVGLDAMNALYTTTYEMDQKLGTEYFQRLKKFILRVQEDDLMIGGAMTDVKGNRGIRPSQQADADMFMHIVEKRDDGIIVRGAKAHQTGSVNSHMMLVMPTLNMTADDADYAVSFAVPTDEKGVIHILGRQTNDTRKYEKTLDRGNISYGIVGGEALVVFDDVFIPNERVFMAGEFEFSGTLVERFASYHRQNYGGCKAGVSDVIIGASAALADIHGIQQASHVREKLTEMIHLTETLYSGSIACSSEGFATKSGAYMVDPLLANITKQNVTRFMYEIGRIAQDLAGGIVATLPSQKDFNNPITKPYLEKYLKGRDGVPTEHRARLIRLIENISTGTALIESMHGAGSPQAQRIMILRQGDLVAKAEYAKTLCGIKDDEVLKKIRGN